jgi:hypothetical protein
VKEPYGQPIVSPAGGGRSLYTIKVRKELSTL